MPLGASVACLVHGKTETECLSLVTIATAQKFGVSSPSVSRYRYIITCIFVDTDLPVVVTGLCRLFVYPLCTARQSTGTHLYE